MDPRNIFDYKCSTCKRIGEPDDFGINERTGAKLKTCKICRRKRLERENAFRERQIAFNNSFIEFAEEPTVTPMIVYSLTTSEGAASNPVIFLPVSTTEAEAESEAEPDEEQEPEQTPERVGS